MLSTIVLTASLLFCLLASIAAWGASLKLGLRWAHAPNATWRRAFMVTAVVFVVDIPLRVLLTIVGYHSRAAAVIAVLAMLVAAVCVPCLIIARAFGLQIVRALQAWLPTLLASLVFGVAAGLIVRPFLFQAFFAPTNAMAPTLLGNHWRAACSQCGQPCYCSPAKLRSPEELAMICANFHVSEPNHIDSHVYGPDRFLVCKFLRPRRWDLVAFKVPDNPEVIYVKRLVGLPGETIVIDDGAVWANEKRLPLPTEIEHIRYASELPGHFSAFSGSNERPATLDDDEYFVLGDFSASSYDSRFWESGAPGHNAFAVPQSHLIGVVTHTYWPPQRWRIFR